MVVLIDADVILDFLTWRLPFAEDAKKILQKCAEGTLPAYVAAHSITNIFYILRKLYTAKERRERLLDLMEIVGIAGIDRYSLRNALINEAFSDTEDCLQAECAKAVNADYIVTRNINDYVYSEVSAILPNDFLKEFAKQEGDTIANTEGNL